MTDQLFSVIVLRQLQQQSVDCHFMTFTLLYDQYLGYTGNRGQYSQSGIGGEFAGVNKAATPPAALEREMSGTRRYHFQGHAIRREPSDV
jgi:hypothetical protein